MRPIRVRPTSADVSIANAIAAHTGREPEEVAEALTWGGDEHVLAALAGAWWLYCRNKDAGRRLASDHILLTTIVASALPHLLKMLFDQERPDRTTCVAIGGAFHCPESGSIHFLRDMPCISVHWLPPPVCFRRNNGIWCGVSALPWC